MWVPVVWNEQLGCMSSSTLYLTNLLIIVFRQLEGRSLTVNLCRYAQPGPELRVLVFLSRLDQHDDSGLCHRKCEQRPSTSLSDPLCCPHTLTGVSFKLPAHLYFGFQANCCKNLILFILIWVILGTKPRFLFSFCFCGF